MHHEILKDRSFAYCLCIDKIEPPKDSILEIIEKNAFNYSSIKSFTIPASLVQLDENWYQIAPKLTDIKIDPNSLIFKEYEDQFILTKSNFNQEDFDVIFAAFPHIEKAEIPSNIKIINSHAFHKCRYIKSIEIPKDSKLQKIGKYAFYKTNISSIFIPPQVEEIGEHAFDRCINLHRVEVSPNSKIKAIEKHTFNHSLIEEILIPNDVTTIGEGSFSRCEKLKKVVISPDSKLQTIGDFAFKCTSLSKFSVPNSLTSIGEGSFAEIKNIFEIEIQSDSKLQTIGDFAFKCTSLSKFSVPNSLTSIGEGSFAEIKNIFEIEIQSDSKLQKIRKFAFNKTKLKSLFIPSGLVDLCEGWCKSMKYLENFSVDPNNRRFKVYENKYLLKKSSIEKDDFDVLSYSVLRNIGTAIIPNFIKIIDPYAFQVCTNLKKVIFEKDSRIRIIGSYAFYESTVEEVVKIFNKN